MDVKEILQRGRCVLVLSKFEEEGKAKFIKYIKLGRVSSLDYKFSPKIRKSNWVKKNPLSSRVR